MKRNIEYKYNYGPPSKEDPAEVGKIFYPDKETGQYIDESAREDTSKDSDSNSSQKDTSSEEKYISPACDIEYFDEPGCLVAYYNKNQAAVRRMRHRVKRVYSQMHDDVDRLEKFFAPLQLPYHTKSIETHPFNRLKNPKNL